MFLYCVVICVIWVSWDVLFFLVFCSVLILFWAFLSLVLYCFVSLLVLVFEFLRCLILLFFEFRDFFSMLIWFFKDVLVCDVFFRSCCKFFSDCSFFSYFFRMFVRLCFVIFRWVLRVLILLFFVLSCGFVFFVSVMMIVDSCFFFAKVASVTIFTMSIFVNATGEFYVDNFGVIMMEDVGCVIIVVIIWLFGFKFGGLWIIILFFGNVVVKFMFGFSCFRVV